MNKNRPQYEAMLEHFLLCFNDIVVCRKVDVPSLNRKFGISDFSY